MLLWHLNAYLCDGDSLYCVLSDSRTNVRTASSWKTGRIPKYQKVFLRLLWHELFLSHLATINTQFRSVLWIQWKKPILTLLYLFLDCCHNKFCVILTVYWFVGCMNVVFAVLLLRFCEVLTQYILDLRVLLLHSAYIIHDCTLYTYRMTSDIWYLGHFWRVLRSFWCCCFHLSFSICHVFCLYWLSCTLFCCCAKYSLFLLCRHFGFRLVCAFLTSVFVVLFQ